MMEKLSKVGPYKKLSLDDLNHRLSILESLWQDFLEFEGESHTKYYIHKLNIFEVIKRQDQRMHYLKVFHDLEYPCEYKYIAIECFWINTLKPFIIIDDKSRLYDCPNEKFSLYLILTTIRTVYEIYKKNQPFVLPSKERIRDILYDFKYCSLTREAMISFVETYADTYGVGIEFILNQGNDAIAKTLRGTNIESLFKNSTDE